MAHAARSTSPTAAISTAANPTTAPRSCGTTKPGGTSVMRRPSSVSGYSRPSCAASTFREASACSRVTLSRRRPMAKMFWVERASSHALPGSIHSCIVIGTHSSGV